MTGYQTSHDPTAVNGRRFLAWILDAVIANAIAIGVMLATVTFTTSTRGSCSNLANEICFQSGSTVYRAPMSSLGTTYLVAFGYYVLVFWILQGLTGATVGKFICGIRVVKENGTACGIGRAIVRSLLWIVDAAPWCVPLLGPILVLTTKDHRRVGDMVGGTYVIGKADLGRPVHAGAPAMGYAVPAGYGAPAAPATPAGPQPTPDSQWDAQRGTWVRYDADLQAWYGLNAQTGQWYTL